MCWDTPNNVGLKTGPGVVPDRFGYDLAHTLIAHVHPSADRGVV